MRENTPLPKLPGYSVDSNASLIRAVGDDANFCKKQSLVFRNGYALTVDTSAIISMSSPSSPATGWQLPPRAEPLDNAVLCNMKACSEKPKWIEYDRKVLRYYGWFEETVPNSSEEQWRTRKIVVLYYLEDDSIQITEPFEANSGLPQGSFIKRHKIPNRTGGFIDMKDIIVGGTIVIYGRIVSLCDADTFTRSYAKSQGINIPEPIPYPINPIEEYKLQKSAPSGLSRSDEDSPSKFAEALLGRKPINRELKKYLQHSKQVLRFYCVHDDRQGLYGERRAYKLHYFLEDNTAEIMEILEPNCGKDLFPAFLKRGPLPKEASGSIIIGGKVASTYKPEDFRLGSMILVHGRNFFLFDCDQFTRTYYQKNFGLGDYELSPIDVSEPKKSLPSPRLPDYNGFGSMEDSLQNCLKLVPKAPKRDMVQLLNKERIVLRFKCRLVDNTNQRLINTDRERRFVLSFFAADNTISVFEPPVKNSGIVGGKYLERAKAQKPGTLQQYYTEHDLLIGTNIPLAGRVFELLEADKFTKDYLGKFGHICSQQNK